MPDEPSVSAAASTQIAPAAAPDASRTMTLFVMVVATLYFGKVVLVPVTLALLLSFLLAPLVGLLRRARLGRVPSVLIAVLLALGVMLALGSVIGTQIAQLTTNLPQYVATVERKVKVVEAYTVGRFADMMGHQAAPTAPGPTPVAPSLQNRPTSAGDEGPVEVRQANATPLELASRYLSPILSPLATIGIVFIVAVFALLQKEDLRDRLIRLFGSTDLHRTTIAIDDGGRRLSRYFLTQFSINTGFGVIIGVGLFFIGVPNPVLWGILSALLRFVPYIGAFISAVLPLALAAAVDPGWSMVLWTLALFLVAEPVTGSVIEPMVYGHSTGLSPFAVVVAAIFWSWLWGPIGLILSTPLTLCLVVLGRHVERLAFLDVLLGDRPALTPTESFYQRILAGDADEAQDLAELLLKDRSLSSYYDEVALKGLQLAANDAERGVLNAQQLERVKATIKVLVHELASYDDREPAPEKGDHGAVAPPKQPIPARFDPAREDLPPAWRTEAPVMCIAGRGPLDEAASEILAQLLGKHGLGARLVPYELVSRTKVATLDVQGIAMVCISYLEISGSPSHLRYLLRRLRQRLPGVPVLVGLWPAEDTVLKDERLRSAVGADYYTSSLRDAVTACLEAAQKIDNQASSETVTEAGQIVGSATCRS